VLTLLGRLHLVLWQRRLVAVVGRVELIARQSDGDGGDVSAVLQSVQTLHERLVDVDDLRGRQLCQLVQRGDAALHNLGDRDRLVDGAAHRAEHQFIEAAFLRLLR
jgi:hypothetical protein